MYGCQKLRENLDEMTKEAASLEHLPSVQAFNEVIEFDSERHVWYFSDLWNGDPPMAPANPGYHTKVQEVKQFVLNQLAQNRELFLTLTDVGLSVRDMWNGVLAGDFVFSFRNSLAAKAYNRMESKFAELKWTLEYTLREWLIKDVQITIDRCSTEPELNQEKKVLMRATINFSIENIFQKSIFVPILMNF